MIYEIMIPDENARPTTIRSKRPLQWQMLAEKKPEQDPDERHESDHKMTFYDLVIQEQDKSKTPEIITPQEEQKREEEQKVIT